MARKIVSSMERNIEIFGHVPLPLATFTVRPDSPCQANGTVHESWTDSLYEESFKFKKTTIRKGSIYHYKLQFDLHCT